MYGFKEMSIDAVKFIKNNFILFALLYDDDIAQFICSIISGLSPYLFEVKIVILSLILFCEYYTLRNENKLLVLLFIIFYIISQILLFTNIKYKGLISIIVSLILFGSYSFF